MGTSRPGGENHAVVTSPGAAGFAPVRIGILPLTELTGSTGAGQSTTLHAFVTLLDAFGAQIKAPSVLRFELYEYVPRSAQAKGSQLFPGQNLDLTGAAENHRYWQDHLRAYEFELEAQVSRDKTYVLQVTCMTPNINGKRLSADYVLKNTP
ncbi:MAG: hypothetical protein MUC88_18130 [Planctomycetes bacterium]|nr:hypothetical protein [Planctomycetota bacterium]